MRHFQSRFEMVLLLSLLLQLRQMPLMFFKEHSWYHSVVPALTQPFFSIIFSSVIYKIQFFFIDGCKFECLRFTFFSQHSGYFQNSSKIKFSAQFSVLFIEIDISVNKNLGVFIEVTVQQALSVQTPLCFLTILSCFGKFWQIRKWFPLPLYVFFKQIILFASNTSFY